MDARVRGEGSDRVAQSGEGQATAPVESAGPGGDRAANDLRSALRVARMEDAERSRAISDLRSAELARLDLLREAIEPVLAAVPDDVEMFDAGLIPVPRPRLFIDMIAFVEMAHDRRGYRFVQDTRQGRVVLAESERLDVMREAVTGYIARRLVEREKALAAEPEDPGRGAGTTVRRGWGDLAWLRTPGAIVLNYLGIAALCVLLWVLGGALYQAWMAPPH